MTSPSLLCRKTLFIWDVAKVHEETLRRQRFDLQTGLIRSFLSRNMLSQFKDIRKSEISLSWTYRYPCLNRRCTGSFFNGEETTVFAQ